ncbi:hypothetical protein KC351_g106 [Hortaea werneckii]|nr:hypothetical protein KC351_g106 [Hortaea werneckii]
MSKEVSKFSLTFGCEGCKCWKNNFSAKPCGSCRRCKALKFKGCGAFFFFSLRLTLALAALSSLSRFALFLLMTC